MEYTVLTPRKIVFGWGRRTEVGSLAARLGRRAWIVCGSRTLQRQGTVNELQERLRSAGVDAQVLANITREPEVEDVDAAVTQLIEEGVQEGDFVLGIGGGAGLDLAKAVAALATNRQGDSVRDFLEGVGSGLTIDQAPLPLLAMPTTAGTGTEATKNAVISSYDPPFKKSLRSERMMPDVVLVDPELTVSCPKSVTAHSGMDAITQLIESAVSKRATAITGALCVEGLTRVFVPGQEPAILRAFHDPQDRGARESLSHAALLSGMALANSGLGMAHGVAAALGVHCRIPHGLACATLLPLAIQANRATPGLLPGISVLVSNPVEVIDALGLNAGLAEVVDAAIREVKRINQQIGIPSRLSELGVRADQIPDIVRSSRGNSMDGNPRNIDDEELDAILRSNL